MKASCLTKAVLAVSIAVLTLKAEVHYVSSNGSASWLQSTDINAPCALSIANTNVVPGDTVYLLGGTYYPTGRNDCIHPGRSGTAGSRIIYASYNNESVILDGTNSNSEAILFSAGWDTGDPGDGRSYITVKGINFANWNQLGELRYASYNEIAECNFSGHKNLNCDYNGFFIYQESKHNWIHGNTWHSFGHFVDRDASCIINIGHDNAGNAENSGNDYNTVENNHFYASGHHVAGVNNAKFNVIRNNYFHNEGWSTEGDCSSWPTGVCGYRVMSMTDASGLDVAGSNLLEDNNIAYGAQYGGPHLVDGASGSGLTLDTDGNIVRYNNFFGNVMYGIRIGSSIAGSTGRNNRIYNNTIYYCGHNLDSWGVVNEDDAKLQAWGDGYRTAFAFYGSSCDGTNEGNVIMNNLTHDIWSETQNLSGSIYYPAFYVSDAAACNSVFNNWGNSGDRKSVPFTPFEDPKFVDPDISDPMALTLVNGKWIGKPDLSLQENSPALDRALNLTQADGAGSNSKTLIVHDARYFQDGTWGSDLARGNFFPDYIAIGTVRDTVQIKSIDYSANTITLAYSMSWPDEAPVWLFKNSKGEIVLSGDAPDYGAHERIRQSSADETKSRPEEFSLNQNYPNPFNPKTVISYKLKVKSEVKLIVYDMLGREVAILVNEVKNAGDHTVEWNGKNTAGKQVGSGVYFYRLKTDNGFVITRKMVFLR